MLDIELRSLRRKVDLVGGSYVSSPRNSFPVLQEAMESQSQSALCESCRFLTSKGFSTRHCRLHLRA